MGTLFHLSPPSSCPLCCPELSSQETHLWGDKKLPMVTGERPAHCPDQHPREWGAGLRGKQASFGSRALRKAAREPGLGDSIPACSRGHRQQEKTGWNGSPTAAARKAGSPHRPQGFPHLFPGRGNVLGGGGRAGRAEPRVEDRPVSNRAGNERKGPFLLKDPSPSPYD